MSQILDTWERILKWLEVNAPETLETLNPGASFAAIEEIEQFLEVRFPEAVRDFLLRCNGQHTKSIAVFPDYYFLLPLAEIRQNWEIEKKVLSENPALAEEVAYEEFSSIVKTGSPKVRACYWHLKWIPVAYCLTGDLYCLDFAPTAQGQSGQVIEFWHDADMRDLIAHSFEELLARYADDLEKGLYFYNTEADSIEKRPIGN